MDWISFFIFMRISLNCNNFFIPKFRIKTNFHDWTPSVSPFHFKTSKIHRIYLLNYAIFSSHFFVTLARSAFDFNLISHVLNESKMCSWTSWKSAGKFKVESGKKLRKFQPKLSRIIAINLLLTYKNEQLNSTLIGIDVKRMWKWESQTPERHAIKTDFRCVY
jgi:hypothetical protein